MFVTDSKAMKEPLNTSQVLHNNIVFSFSNLGGHAHDEVVHILTRLHVDTLETKDGFHMATYLQVEECISMIVTNLAFPKAVAETQCWR